MTGLVPVIHVVRQPERFRSAGIGAAWMAEISPAMTERAVFDPLGSNPSANALLPPQRAAGFKMLEISLSEKQ
jgi:hypothetical protein